MDIIDQYVNFNAKIIIFLNYLKYPHSWHVWAIDDFISSQKGLHGSASEGLCALLSGTTVGIGNPQSFCVV